MLERWITALAIEDPGLETPAATRERLKERFAKNATRRMTQLGLLVGAVLEPLVLTDEDTLVYASSFAETRTLEGYLDSFPTPSPTQFQTSIHPSAVQQALIGRQQPVRHFFPLTGSADLPLQALQVALLATTPRVILCGGEERGTWLLDAQAASARTFAFAVALSLSPTQANTPMPSRTLGRIAWTPLASPLTKENTPDTPATAAVCPLPVFFDLLQQRRPFNGLVAPGQRLSLSWL